MPLRRGDLPVGGRDPGLRGQPDELADLRGAVQDVAGDAYRGEAPKAYIKLREGQQATADEILEFLKERISKIEMPSEIEFRSELPKTMVGKLSKKELKAEMQAKTR